MVFCTVKAVLKLRWLFSRQSCTLVKTHLRKLTRKQWKVSGSNFVKSYQSGSWDGFPNTSAKRTSSTTKTIKLEVTLIMSSYNGVKVSTAMTLKLLLSAGRCKSRTLVTGSSIPLNFVKEFSNRQWSIMTNLRMKIESLCCMSTETQLENDLFIQDISSDRKSVV